ncbi:MAG: paraquat-inducible protein A [Candidatus Omnitrophota bacterium]|jgi:paraquat-inducible protein A
MTSAMQEGYARCHTCGKLVEHTHSAEREEAHCPRCDSVVHARKPHSLGRTWALTIAATVLLVPAYSFPIMTALRLGQGEPNTILSGISELVHEGMYGIAFLIFVASIAVPVVKLLGLLYLLLSIQLRWTSSARQRTVAYRFIEFIGRWSMLDIFVISLLVALVQLQQLAYITAGIGTTAFAAVVVITMFAAECFDPRLIWDEPERDVKGA